ncbi:MAG: hypothetical protein P4L83_07495 [Nevskia sp.]|nr:hypothetical protein [Nevskia sp.]
MPFVNEKIREEDKARIDWREFSYWDGDKQGLSRDPPSLWTIDHDRDVFFVNISLGRPDNESPTYGLSWKGAFIRVVAKGDWESSNRKGQGHGYWEITDVEIPSNLEPRRAEILEVLKEAISVYGFLYSRKNIQSVHIKFA